MGRLPAQFAGRVITYREPFSMEGTAFVIASQSGYQFPAGTFTHASDKPFEIHRMLPRIWGFTENNVIVDFADQPSQEYLLSLVRITINDLGKTMQMQQQPTYLNSLVKGTSELTWEFAEPAYMAKGELFAIQLDVDPFPAAFDTDDIAKLRVQITFEGFQLITAPASDNR